MARHHKSRIGTGMCTPRKRLNDWSKEELGLMYCELQGLIALVALASAYPHLPAWATARELVAVVTAADENADVNVANHLHVLEGMGFIERHPMFGAPYFWRATRRGFARLEMAPPVAIRRAA